MRKPAGVEFRRMALAGVVAVGVVVAVVALVPVAGAGTCASGAGCAGSRLVPISTDPYTNSGAQHATEDDPGIASAGPTVVAAFQQGLFGAEAGAGGAVGIGFATSRDSGHSWVHGSLPGVGPGSGYSGAVFPAVAYDRAHRVWLVTFVAAVANPTDPTAPPVESKVLVSRSLDGGRSWSAPATITAAGSPIDFADTSLACDTYPLSRYYGSCYAGFWRHNNAGGSKVIRVAATTDGGVTWGRPQGSADDAAGIRSVPLVRPDGTVVVVFTNWLPGQPSTQVRAFTSTDGGTNWSASRLVAPITAAPDPGVALTGTTLVSATVDGTGTLYAVWQDCRFRPTCTGNDLVLAESRNGAAWGPVRSVTRGTGDDAYPALGADPLSGGRSARLAVTYYTYPHPGCTRATCTLQVRFVSSTDRGATWSTPTRLAGPVPVSWLAAGPGPDGSDQGWVITTYLTTTILPSGNALTAFPAATRPTDSTLHQGMYAVRGGTPAPHR